MISEKNSDPSFNHNTILRPVTIDLSSPVDVTNEQIVWKEDIPAKKNQKQEEEKWVVVSTLALKPVT